MLQIPSASLEGMRDRKRQRQSEWKSESHGAGLEELHRCGNLVWRNKCLLIHS